MNSRLAFHALMALAFCLIPRLSPAGAITPVEGTSAADFSRDFVRDSIPYSGIDCPSSGNVELHDPARPVTACNRKLQRQFFAADIPVLRVTGLGAPPADAANATIGREMAERAALTDARRKLVQALADLKTADGRRLEDRLGEKNFSRNVQGFIKGYTVIDKRELPDGRIEIDVELPLDDRGGLSRYLAE